MCTIRKLVLAKTVSLDIAIMVELSPLWQDFFNRINKMLVYTYQIWSLYTTVRAGYEFKFLELSPMSGYRVLLWNLSKS